MLKPGDHFAHYELEDVAGVGGTAVVYRARDLRLDRPVALKLIGPHLAADPMVRERLNREAMLAAAVRHPNIAPVFEAGEHDGTIYLARGWVDGDTLAQLVDRDAPLAVGRAAALLVQVAHALQAVHDAGLIHRDITPGNVIVDFHDRAYLTDFGITRRATDITGLTGHDQLLGTLDFVAPEQIAGAGVDRLSDVYSLGCLGWYLLCGEPPYPRDGHAAKLYAHLSADYAPVAERRDDVPGELDELLGRAMAKDPGARPASAAAFAGELAHAAAGVSDAVPPPVLRPAPVPDAEPDREPAVRAPRRRFAGALTGVLASALLAAAPAALYLGLHDGSAGAQTIELGRPASALAASGGRVMVGNGPGGALTALGGHAQRRVVLLGSPADLVAAGTGRVYVAGARRLTVLTEGRSAPARRFSLPGTATALAAGGDDAWIGLAGRSELVHVSGGQTTTVPTAAPVSALARSGPSLWGLDAAGGTLQRFSAESGMATGRAVHVARRPLAIAATPNAVWVLDAASATVVRVDPRSGRPVGAPTPVPPGPVAMAADARSVWVISARTRTATRIDARSGRPAQTEGVPPRAHAVAIARGQAWVASAGGRVTRLPVR